MSSYLSDLYSLQVRQARHKFSIVFNPPLEVGWIWSMVMGIPLFASVVRQ